MADSFNDLSRPPPVDSASQLPPLSSHGATTPAAHNGGDSSYVPRPKRIACVVCRRRKLRCDGRKPSCGTCSRLGHECAYDEVRKKSGPKRGYVKQLEARLAQVETLLMSNEPGATQPPSAPQSNDFNNLPLPDNSMSGMPEIPEIPDIPEMPELQHDIDSSISPPGTLGQQPQSAPGYLPGGGFGSDLRWDMIGLGLEEPLPNQDVIDELNQIYFEKIHPSTPIIHMPRFLTAMNLSYNVRPPVYLQYAIMTNLPASEEAFVTGKPQQAPRLADLMVGDGASILSPYGSNVFMASLFGRNLTHLHRPDPQDNDNDLNGEFWKRHRSYDNILLNFALSLPNHLRLPAGIADPNVIFCNMSIHTSTICLHQAAIFKAEKNKMPSQIVTESKRRCIVAADQISSIMKIISHLDLTTMNPFMSFCVYVAARVFVQYLKSRPSDSTVQSSLQFVLSALNALRSKNPLTESFMLQLDVDIEGTAYQNFINPSPGGCPMTQKLQKIKSPDDPVECIPIIHIRDEPGTTENPRQDVPQPSYSGNTGRSGFPTTGPLPSRQKQTPAQQPNMNINGVSNFNPGTEIAGSGVSADMDYSPDLSDRNNAPSDHPTPSTINSCSNTSSSKTDQTSPATIQQQSSLNNSNQGSMHSLDGANILNISPGGGNLGAGQCLPGYSETPFNATGPGDSFSMSSTWEYSATQSSDHANLVMTPGGMDSLNEAQWAQLLNGTNWDAWRN
ncbi:hypothetical protein MW887_009182 [Aspergillus wentii]|nr:hypothetical protein MW887_009182 [Aspergillus wentii]